MNAPPDPKFRLLVVDDNERNRDIISRQLGRRDYDVLTADGGASGLAMIESEDIDLVILDIMMPRIDGIEVLRRVRKKYSLAQLPIIMATAKTDSQDIVQCAELGANDHVGKPIDFDVLAAKVQTLLRLKAVAAPARSDADEPTLDELKAGVLLAGKYRLEDEIGVGAFGTVYRAHHQGLDFDVAVKVLQAGLTAKTGALKRFQREGAAACRVRHPNAVAVSDYGVTETGVAFLVMELLEGQPLTDELKALGKISPQRTSEILTPVCDVLAEAHAKNLVHRDIKPENVFLHQAHQGEVVKVLDFGIAKLMGEAVVQDNLTADGWFVGTPSYMAPERFARTDYDGRADVYSLGVMLFEMLTGVRPFRTFSKDPMLMIAQHTHKAPPTLRSFNPDLPVELEEPVAWALRKDPQQRPDAMTLAQEFARQVEKSPKRGKPLKPRKPSIPRSRDATSETQVHQAGTEAKGLRHWLRKLWKKEA
jgi:serine/threonine protein kinase/CheY-like chemotaxis protein